MFDFKKITMLPRSLPDFKPGATEAQIRELEQYIGHALPESYKTVLRQYNGGMPKEQYFDVIDQEIGLPAMWEFFSFYQLTDDKISPGNIWWQLENRQETLGPDTMPFADDGDGQAFYFKWVDNDNEPQIWFFAYLDLDEPEQIYVMSSFDELLGALYAVD